MKDRLERMDDLLNPITVKELRQSLNSRWLPLTGGAILLILPLILLGAAHSLDEDPFRGRGMAYTVTLLIFLGIGILFGVILPMAYRFAADRKLDGSSNDLLTITALSPWRIVLGTFGTAVELQSLFYALCLPALVIGCFLRGIALAELGLMLLGTFWCVMALGEGLLLGACLGKRTIGAVVAAILFIGCVGGFVPLISLPYSRLFGEYALYNGSYGTLAILLMLTLHYAALAPAGSDRMRPARIMAVLVLALTMMLNWGLRQCGWMEPDPFFVITLLQAALIAGIIGIIGAMERTTLSLRMRQTMPRRRFRPLWCLFSSGSLGGIVLSTLLFAAAAAVLVALMGVGAIKDRNWAPAGFFAYGWIVVMLGRVAGRFYRRKAGSLAPFWGILTVLIGSGVGAIAAGFTGGEESALWFFPYGFMKTALLQQNITALTVWGIAALLLNLPDLLKQVADLGKPARDETVASESPSV